MITNISTPSIATPSAAGLPAIASRPSGSFADVLNSAVNQVESAQQTVHSAAIDLLANGRGDVHSVALAAQRAELTLELFQQVKNKFVQAYQEVMKMPM